MSLTLDAGSVVNQVILPAGASGSDPTLDIPPSSSWLSSDPPHGTAPSENLPLTSRGITAGLGWFLSSGWPPTFGSDGQVSGSLSPSISGILTATTNQGSPYHGDIDSVPDKDGSDRSCREDGS